MAFLLPIAYSNGLGSPFFSLRAGLLLVVLGLGLPSLLAMLLDPAHRRLALPPFALIMIAALSTALSGDAVVSVIGPYGAGTGLLFVLSLVALWALGYTSGAQARDAVVTGILAAAGVNSVVALLQPLVDLDALGLALEQSRSHGLTGNPVHLGVFLTGALPLAVDRFLTDRRWAPAVLLLGAGLQTSGSRFAFLLVLAGCLGLITVRRDRPAVLAVFLITVGLLMGEGALASGGGASTAQRLDDGGLAETSTMQRIYSWTEAGGALADRPLLGHGPGRYLQATSPHRDLRMARIAPDSYFRDAHNIVVHFLVTTGVAGAIGLLVWLFTTLRAARGVLLWFVLGAIAMHLVQPMFPATTPLVFLALGVASAPQTSVRLGTALRGVRLATAGCGLVAGSMLVVGDLRLRQAYDAYSADDMLAATRLLPPWPDPASLLAGIYVFEGTTAGRNDLTLAATWQEKAARRDEGDPRGWNQLGLIELKRGRHDAAGGAFGRALRANPYSRRALRGQLDTALAAGACGEALGWLDRLATIGAASAELRETTKGCESKSR